MTRIKIINNASLVIKDDEHGEMTPEAGIKYIRRSLNMNTSQFSKAINKHMNKTCSPRTVENWEQGRPIPTAIFIAIATELGERRCILELIYT